RDVPVSDLFRISVFYNLSLMVLPSKLGELTYPYLLNRLGGITITEGLASLIVSRIYDVFAILIIFFIAFVGFQGAFQVDPLWMMLLIAFLIGLTFLAFFYMSDLLRLSSRILGRILERTGLSRRKSFQWVLDKTHVMAEDFDAIQARRTYLAVTLASLSSWAFSYWMFYAFLKGFGISRPVMKMIFACTIAMIANALPISGLGNWGILEAGWAAGFMLAGLSKVEAIATGFGVHILLFMTSALISLFCWITLKRN
ncbi:MAG TPA: lysylphosphatidylglycerol synthase transmembrane domain-containing protein, partial [Thermodesulfobacteriota bacterium]|nr:lysylphosphatidylglycerol synthase transmembrane domain-containing protein [Thermodesulfobacteriota bacterium]